ncbi:sensor domain-containing diguanylate cyclase [Microvirga arsenatis]|uniref:diguanylate cyclase n=1 Tax=Microvirga arsenatis TaxID=2692265 RepID=A0ABW9YXS3_9HYPH|nr:sensor domain-containing diguanylate cyclase [Microvirga arsenatis]NBJ13138.1 diguanylate cyclase [Microvirga arsenatis]NBJ25182.1 diguanylate cyclase [Microvirga arsenatis]
MKRLFSEVYLHLIAGIIAIGILGISAHTLWVDRLSTLQEAERSSRNVLTAVARDLDGSLELLDLSLKGAMEGLRHLNFRDMPADLQYRMLFDRAASSSFMGTLLLVDAAGNLIADAGPIIAPRSLNVADREYFTVHKENLHLGLYVSRPFRSKTSQGEISIAISRRLSNADGSFAGVVMGALPLDTINQRFSNLSLGAKSAINLFRNDGILLTRFPYDEKQINQDLSGSPHVQRLLREKSGTFESISPIDGVRRIISFERLERYPLVLTVALSVDDVFSSWWRKVLILSVVTLVLCCAVVGLTILFQRELKRRTRAETKLRRIARTDDLTGLPNRRAFRETFEREWRQSVRSSTALSLLYVDADYFKNFNDRYGHGRGDEVLRAIAGALDANIRRPRDVAARFGGEEFVIVLPETDLAGALTIAEKIRQTVTAMSIAHEGSPYHIVTVSIGAASVQPSRGSDKEILLEAADQALYQAKASGRNAIHSLKAEARLLRRMLPNAAA